MAGGVPVGTPGTERLEDEEEVDGKLEVEEPLGMEDPGTDALFFDGSGLGVSVGLGGSEVDMEDLDIVEELVTEEPIVLEVV